MGRALAGAFAVTGGGSVIAAVAAFETQADGNNATWLWVLAAVLLFLTVGTGLWQLVRPDEPSGGRYEASSTNQSGGVTAGQVRDVHQLNVQPDTPVAPICEHRDDLIRLTHRIEGALIAEAEAINRAERTERARMEDEEHRQEHERWVAIQKERNGESEDARRKFKVVASLASTTAAQRERFSAFDGIFSEVGWSGEGLVRLGMIQREIIPGECEALRVWIDEECQRASRQ